MIKSIRQFFDTHIQSASGEQRQEQPQRALQLATAALLLEVARADFHVAKGERDVITNAVRQMFGLSVQETAELVALAESEMEDATCLYEFTRLVNDNFDQEQKLKVVENLWQVAFADLDKDKYEEHLIRRVCDLLYVSPKDFVRLREQERG
ncbi:MAG: TerB family tellurite resistance protein [Pseudomonadota bacterium]|nr:TerB family tellurite resistance protein [Pseudomonadota bacterium]